jgi:Spy/CpxP family protein refolding chaperone
MKDKLNFRLGALGIILGALFLLASLSLAPAKEGNWERMKEKAKKIKDLNELKLSPEKEKALLSIEEKYAKERKDVVATLKKYQEDLKAALAAANQDEAKINGLVSAISSSQDKLLDSFKMERDEAMALMTPNQKGQFIMIIGNWYQEIIKKSENKKS